MNEIAGKAVTAEEAQLPEFKDYIDQVIKNAKAMSDEFINLGYNVITNGTDNHMFLIDLRNKFSNLSGKDVQDFLDNYKITLNKNCVPGDTRSPMLTSGIRIGTAAMTTKGWKESDFIHCARAIDLLILALSKYN